MIKSFRIEGFRGIRAGEVNELERVNIIVGKNNSGKSSIIEALFLCARKQNLFLQILTPSASIEKGIGYLLYRRMDHDERSLFYAYEIKPIKYELTLEGGERLVFYVIKGARTSDWYVLLDEPALEGEAVIARVNWEPFESSFYYVIERKAVEPVLQSLALPPPPPPYRTLSNLPSEAEKRLETLSSALMIDALHITQIKEVMKACWEKLKIQGLDDFVIDALKRAYEAGVLNIEYTPSGIWLVTLRDKGKYAVRLDDLGDGTKYALAMLAEILVAKPSLLLIEEPECHHHPKGLEQTFDAIFSILEGAKTQTFITTHSLEVVQKLISLSKKHSLTAKIHHFTLKNGILTSTPLDAPSVEVVTDLGADVRFLDEYA